MGNFPGHIIPGLIFFFFGLYYAVLISLVLLRGQQFLFSSLPPWDKGPQSWRQKFPIEGLLKVVGCIPSFLGEFFYPFGANRLAIIDWDDPERPFLHHSIWQHATMYTFFIISGLVDIVSQGWLAKRQIKLEQAALTLAFFGTALLLTSHIQGKDALEVQGHLLLVLPNILIVLVMVIELWFPAQAVLWIFKIWMVLLFGSWLIHLGFIIYYPITGHPWRADKPGDIMFLTTFFCWHLILTALLVAGVYGLCSLWHHWYPHQQKVMSTGYQLCPTDSSPEERKKLMVEVN
ncbi:transmembrane epididymal protein 1A-like [Macrotis lagotis]|uniref:transmembrane epididymal protein 1A-like n=1 Tax=Macrotis lagotis TaxID=92651 RepID=UPI003D69A18B